jgi:diaminopimelate epimerase
VLSLVKAHAYGNDFLYAQEEEVRGADLTTLSRRLCERHRGGGADGLVVYTPTAEGARMRLFNADGSPSELSGNGLRGLAALVIRARGTPSQVIAGARVVIETDAGVRELTLVERADPRFVFRASMGHPQDLRWTELDVVGVRVRACVLSVGNPQCVVLGPLPDDERFATIGRALERHAAFPQGTNVEFAQVDAPDRVSIRIWERGVGPTESSGTGTCAAAAAAIAGADVARRLTVVAPGGAQEVEWTDDGLVLTGAAELVWEGTWLATA